MLDQTVKFTYCIWVGAACGVAQQESYQPGECIATKHVWASFGALQNNVNQLPQRGLVMSYGAIWFGDDQQHAIKLIVKFADA